MRLANHIRPLVLLAFPIAAWAGDTVVPAGQPQRVHGEMRHPALIVPAPIAAPDPVMPASQGAGDDGAPAFIPAGQVIPPGALMSGPQLVPQSQRPGAQPADAQKRPELIPQHGVDHGRVFVVPADTSDAVSRGRRAHGRHH